MSPLSKIKTRALLIVITMFMASWLHAETVYLGSPHILQYFHQGPWNVQGGESTVAHTFTLPDNGGTQVNFSFENALKGVDVTDPNAPDTTGALPATWSHHGTNGMAAGEATVARFDSGDQFSLVVDHQIAIEAFTMHEYQGGEEVRITWTDEGIAKSLNLIMTTANGVITIGGRRGNYPLSDPIIADANTPIIFTNVTPPSSDHLRLCSIACSLVLNAPPYYEPSDDGFVQMFGVNIAGAEFNSGNLPGTHGYNYFYPNEDEVEYYHSKGLNLIRLPFKWKRLQNSLYAPLSTNELALIDGVLALAAARDMKVILDMHDYGHYDDDDIKIGNPALPHSAYADVWLKIADHFKNNDAIYGYGLMNEPVGMAAGGGNWPVAAQTATDAIRSVDAKTWIIVGGENWSSATKWRASNPNLDVIDPSDKLIYEAHCYFSNAGNDNYGSWSAEQVYPYEAIHRVEPFVQWLKERDARGFVGEYGIPGNEPRWNDVLENFMEYLGANGLSATYWAGGRYWNNYSLGVHPSSNYTVDRPQMAVLTKDFAYTVTQEEVDIAYAKIAVASSIQNSSKSADKAVDGDDATFWSSSFADDEWIYVDLEQSYGFDRVEIVWENAYASEYRIQVSNDAASWTDIYSTTTGNGGTDTLTALAGNGRYVRLYCDVRGTGWGNGVRSFRIYSSESGVPVASNLTGTDIGSTGAAGNNSESGDSYTIQASGYDIYGTADSFRFLHQTMTGDGEITALVSSLTATHSWAKAGLMMRESTDANARNVFVLATNGTATNMQYRSTTGGSTANISGTGTIPHWLRLSRSGDTFTGYHSSDGVNWTTIGAQTIAGMPTNLEIGLAATSHNNSVLTTAVFDNVTLPGDTTPTVPTNLTEGKTATASTEQNSSRSADMAVDGDGVTRWSSIYADNEWIYVDLGQSYDIDEVVLSWEAAYASGYRIQVSDNASTWTDIYTTTTGNGGTDQLTNLSGNGRYVRILCETRGTSWGNSLYEIEVYGSL
ncbi:discoidin domain-containing protein [Cerasicoccus arenae]|uniref:F5/8 type C domain-containing protein n=1 Tax=Cerasicoccus arenae TaxID=424488 RepID=A0A8J3DBJ9_9BACT|nr:discoidin domain-containing protein [Cerasicoccus arenae]MBK1859821.1 discoidin domain-containing protein [Cerasicoccus arenae]GHC01530.1 hypothetical protein GCM10007047_17550 [Cerasicoccus arenae]